MSLLLFTGFSSVGKSTLARVVNIDLGYAFVGEREILHELAEARGYQRSRYWFAVEGLEVILAAARLETFHQILELGGKGVIIDGVYDPGLLTLLRETFINTSLITVQARLELREQRMAGEGRLGSSLKEARSEINFIDNLKKTAGIEKVIDQADIVVENNEGLLQGADEIKKKLTERGIVFRGLERSY